MQYKIVPHYQETFRIENEAGRVAFWKPIPVQREGYTDPGLAFVATFPTAETAMAATQNPKLDLVWMLVDFVSK